MFPESPSRISSLDGGSDRPDSKTRAVTTIPGVQKPHWRAPCTRNSSWIGLRASSWDRPSIVHTAAFSACTESIRHDLVNFPSTITVQEPHTPCSQPTFVPVSRKRYRRESARLSRLGTVTVTGRPFTVMETGWSFMEFSGHRSFDSSFHNTNQPALDSTRCSHGVEDVCGPPVAAQLDGHVATIGTEQGDGRLVVLRLGAPNRTHPGEVTRSRRDLVEAHSAVVGERNAYPGHDLVVRRRRRVGALYELACRNLSTTGRGLEVHARSEGRTTRDQFCRGIPVGETAADRPALAYRLVADVARRLRQQRGMSEDRGVSTQGGVRDESPEVQGSIDDPDSVEVLQPPDVYQRFRSREPQVHEGDQALPSCDHAGPFALVQHVQRLVHRSGPVVVEHRRLHESFSRAASSDGGEMGVASMWIDHWKAASTAEATAAYTGMVPLSPTPLTPSRLSGLGDVM